MTVEHTLDTNSPLSAHGPSGRDPLVRIHRRFMAQQAVLDELTPERFEAFDQTSRETGSRAWRTRAGNEYGSVAQFSQLLHRLAMLGTPLELCGTAARLIHECRHAELCQAIVDALDGGGARMRVRRAHLSLHEHQPDPWLAVAGSLLTACCLGEAVSVNG